MEATADMQTRHAAILGRLAELGMDLAEQLHADATAAETPAERAQIAVTFHRISRSVRQTLALEARLLRMAHEGREREETRQRARIDRRAEHIEERVERLIWTEHDDETEVVSLLSSLIDTVKLARHAEDFETRPVEAIIADIARELGLRVPPPQGEGDHEVVEGVEAHSANRPGLQPPRSPAVTALPEGEQLEALRPDTS